MKKNWMEPQIEVQQFMANEYVAACGDSGIVYNFECDAGNEGTSYLIVGSDGKTNHYHPCHITHEAESDDPFIAGEMYSCNYGEWCLTTDLWAHTKVDDIIIWRGVNGDNTHCTLETDKTKWETAKS